MDANYKKDSLVGRVYFWFHKVTREERPSEEDTCHVRKVVFLYAPLAWFFVQPIFGTKIRPFMIALVVVAVCLSVAAVSFGILFWKELLWGFVMIVVLLLLLGSMALLEEAAERFCQWLEPKICRPVQWD